MHSARLKIEHDRKVPHLFGSHTCDFNYDVFCGDNFLIFLSGQILTDFDAK